MPYRSLLFLSIAAAYAQAREIKTVFSGYIDTDHVQEIDCSMKFFNSLGDILSDYGTIELKMPFKSMTKFNVIKKGIGLNVPIGLTYSCQVNSDVPCGACPNCTDRLEAFQQLYSEYKKAHD